MHRADRSADAGAGRLEPHPGRRQDCFWYDPADYPPFEFYNSKFELDGFDIALAKAIGEQLGLEVQFKDYAFDGLLDAVHLGAVDSGIAAISVTRTASRWWISPTSITSATPWRWPATPLPARSARPPTEGLTVGVQRGTTFQARAQEMLVDEGVIPQENLVHYPNVSAGDRGPAQRQPRRGTDGREDGRGGDEERQRPEAGRRGVLPAAVRHRRAQGVNLTNKLNQALVTLQSNGTFAGW